MQTTDPSETRSAPARGLRWRGAALAAAVVILHWSTLSILVRRWYYEDDYSYAFFVPLVSLYLIWQKRRSLLSVSRDPARLGFVVMLFAFLCQILGIAAGIGYLQGLSIVILLIGIALFLGGRRVLRIAAFPILYLVLMIPLPGAVHSAIAFPLQLFASRVSAVILELLGIAVARDGNILQLSGITLQVAEACSGIRSMTGLLGMGILLGYLVSTRTWERILLALSTIPIGIAANVLRVTGTGLVCEYVGRKYGQGFYHGFSAWIIFVFALVVLLLETSLLSALFGEAATADAAPSADEGSP